jgi:hypothetical protein
VDDPHVGVVAHGLPGKVDQAVKATSGETGVYKLTLLFQKNMLIK